MTAKSPADPGPSRDHPLQHKALAPLRFARHAWLYFARADARWRQQRGMAPFPLYRWAASICVLLWTAIGSNGGIANWWHAYAVWIVIAAAAVAGPEVTRLEVGGVKMELLRETRSDLRTLNAQLTQLQIQQASAAASASSGANSGANASVVIQQTGAAAAEVAIETARGQLARKVPAREVLAKYASVTPESAWSAGPPRPGADLSPARGVPYTPADPEGTVMS